MNSLLMALKFLSILPFPPQSKTDSKELGKSTAFFPLVGALIGLIIVGLNAILSHFLPFSLNNLILVVALIVIRGGLHLDGLIDTADALFSQRSKDKALEIMRDSRIGTFGALALVLAVLIKWDMLNQLTPQMKWRLLILAPSLGEWAVVYCTFLYPYARTEGIGKVFAQETGWLQFIMASVTAVFVLVSLIKDEIIIPLLIFLAVVAGTSTYIARRLQGFTGDSYGAIGELGEISAFLLFGIFAK